MVFAWFLTGMAAWTLTEYVLHRWAGHDRRLVHRSGFGREHTRHHTDNGYFAPAWKKLSAAAALVLVLGGPAVWHWSLHGLALILGFVSCYALYELLHRRLHTHAPANAYGRWARRHHFHHHFGNPRSNHGVTTPLWDLVFGTYVRPGPVTVPQQLAMPWLLDETGSARPEFSATFPLRRRHGA